MKMRFNRAASASVLAGVALTFAGCSIVAPKYFEASRIRHSISKTSWKAVHPYLNAKSVPKLIKDGSTAAGDSSSITLKDAEELCSGAYGKKLMSHALFSDSTRSKLWDIAYKTSLFANHFMPAPPASIDSLRMLKAETDSLAGELPGQLKKEVLALFSKLQEFRTDFLGEFYALHELQMQCNSDTTSLTRLENATSAFSHIMQKNKIPYVVEWNFAKGLMENRMDCDLSSYLFIQFGRELGMDLIGVNMKAMKPDSVGHFAVAYRENGKITHYIETTLLFYGPDFPDQMDAAARSEKLAKWTQELDTAKAGLIRYQEEIELLRKDSLDNDAVGMEIKKQIVSLYKEEISTKERYIANIALHGNFFSMLPDAIYTAADWEADNVGKWGSIKYIEASDLNKK